MSTQSSRPLGANYRSDLDRSAVASREVRKAIMEGRLFKPSYCSKCNRRNPVAHHFDYDRPLDVQWLCALCHARVHRNIKFLRQWQRFLILVSDKKYDSFDLLAPLHYKNGRPRKKKFYQQVWEACS